MDEGKFQIFKWLLSHLSSLIKKPGEILRGMSREGIYPYLKERMRRPTKDEILEGNVLGVMFKLGWPMMVATF
ncbi:MAG: hypothetical protein ACOC5D_07445, partial [Thermoplasmatota archaeon]